MIAFLTGRIASKAEDHCVIDVGGIGYRVAMSTGSLSALPAEGDVVTVHTYMHIREDEMSLFGFESPAEKALFEKLITVSGVGPKVALAALSSFDAAVLAQAIVDEDAAVVSSVPGIGGKTAQRIILDLKDKLASVGIASSSVSGEAGAATEAKEALAAMGFSAAEAAAAIRGFDGPASDAEALLKHALGRLGGGA